MTTPFDPFITNGSAGSTFPFGASGWLADNASSWISPKANETSKDPNSSVTPYVYQGTFTLNGITPTTAVITGQWTADNYGYIVVNGVQVTTGTSGNIANLDGQFETFHSFTLNSSNAIFLAGTNTIQFDVFNNPSRSPDVTGVNVDITSGTYRNTPAVPEPATLGFMGLGLAALGLARRKWKR